MTDSPFRIPEITEALSKIHPLETFPLSELVRQLQTTSASLINVFEDLQTQSTEVVSCGEVGITKIIKILRRNLRDNNKNHEKRMEELHLLLKHYLGEKLIEHLKDRARREIEREIDEVVQLQVTECLRAVIPQDQQNMVAKQRKEMAELRAKLKNSENRRSNAMLRSNRPNDHLEVIYMPNGKVSRHFPNSLQELFDLDTEKSKTLMLDYEIPDISEERDRNLNRFMQFCGVSYQLVRTGSDTRRVGTQLS